MAGDILPMPQSTAIEQPSPITVQVPQATQLADAGARPSQVQYQSAANNFNEASAALSRAGDRNLQALAAFSPLVQGVLQRQQEGEFANGYLQAQQGKSLKEIAGNNPFSKIFGDGEAVRGARAAQAENASSALVSWTKNNIRDLSGMSADAQRKAVADFTSTLNTGDSESDARIAESAMRLFPSIMDNITRASEGEAQRQAAISQADVLTQHADNLQYAGSQVANGQMSPESYATIRDEAIRAAQPLPGQSPDSYRNALQSNVLSLTRKGQFDMANALHDQVLNHMLTPDEQYQFQQQQRQANAEWLKNNPVSRDYSTYTGTLPQQIEAGRYNSVADLRADMDRMNGVYRTETNSLTPLMDNEQQAHMQARFESWQQQQAAARAKAGMKELDDQAKRTLYMEGFASGSPSLMTASGIDPRQKMAYETAEATKFLTEPGQQSAENLGKLAASGYTLSPLKEKLGGTLSMLKGGGVPKESDITNIQIAYDKLRQTPYGMGAAEAYFGDDLKIVQDMQGMDMSKKENQQFIRERAQASTQKTQVSQDTMKAANKLVDDQFNPGWWSRTFGDAQARGLGLENQLKDNMRTEVANVMNQYPNWSESQVMEAASVRVRSKTTTLGNRLITGPGNKAVFSSINEGLNIKMRDPSDSRLDSALSHMLGTKLGTDTSNDVGGIDAFDNGTLYVTVQRPNGGSQHALISPSELSAYMNEHEASEAKGFKLGVDNVNELFPERSRNGSIQAGRKPAN